ncbi:ester cyclase [Streptomyces sp. SID8379]|uniref:ester cyclase n=1 Tax=unclassified Streptomyces TaxID=2593676 RepID=UPI0003638641|nr:MULTISPECIES: ester cyclase [unclassified Streptomyces]MYW62992.1 ester cyclase [Streptomyces sp. SID8379]
MPTSQTPAPTSATTTAATDHTAILTRFHDAANTGDPAAVAEAMDAYFAPDLDFHTPIPMDVTGIEALKRVWEILLRAFPDLRVTVEETIAQADKVVVRNTVTGTHLGEYRGRPATGKSVSYREIFIFRFAGGRVVEIQGVVDVLSQLRQLGMVPS